MIYSRVRTLVFIFNPQPKGHDHVHARDSAQGWGLRDVYPAFYCREEADRLLAVLLDESAPLWESHERLPRLVRWVGDFDYAYTGFSHRAAPWTPVLREMRMRVEKLVFGESLGQFQGVLLNWYRDGNDSVGFHADDEAAILKDSPIASISLGAVRKFVLRHHRDKREPRREFELAHGSLLVMRDKTQTFWRHSVPKQPEVREERLNLTFRQYAL